jgi:hypothetical protein
MPPRHQSKYTDYIVNEQVISGVGDPHYVVDDEGFFTNKGSVPKPLTQSLSSLAMGSSNQYASKFYEYAKKQEDSLLEEPQKVTMQTPYKYFANLFERENQKALMKQMTAHLPPIVPTSQTPASKSIVPPPEQP